jgi:hypothetical protein
MARGKKEEGRLLLTNGASAVEGHTLSRQDSCLHGCSYFYSVHIAEHRETTAKKAMAGSSHFLTSSLFVSHSIACHFILQVKRHSINNTFTCCQVSNIPTIGPIFKGQNFLTRKDGTNRLSRNVGTVLPLYAA